VTYPSDSQAFSNASISWNTSTAGWTRSETVGSYTRTTSYDAFLQPVTDNEANTRYTAKSYDADGRVTFASYVEGSANPNQGMTYAFDGIGRMNSSTDEANYAITYTPSAHRLAVKDRDGNSTTYTYKQYDTPSLDWPVTIASPVATTTIGRNLWGQVTSITRGGTVRSRGYNSYQQLQSITDPERDDAITIDYDNAGNLWHVDRNGAIAETRSYDTRNRLSSITYANGDPSAAFDWWPTGDVKSQARGSNRHAYIYNTRHEIKNETITTDNGSYALKYDYNSLAHLTTFTYPDSTSVTYNPDILGQPNNVGSFATNIDFYPHGAVKAFTYGNLITHGMTLTSDNRLLPGEVYDSGVTDLVYTYDGNAFPKSIADGESGGALSRTFTYDAANRLSTASAAHLWGSTTFNYDALDNLSDDQTGSAATAYPTTPTSNLPYAIKAGSTTTALTWDGEGNLQQKGSGSAASVFTFDTANELTQLVQGGTSYRYSYDGKGDRSTSSADTGSGSSQQTDSVYDAAGRLVYESASTAPPADRIFANGFQAPTAATQTTRYVYLGNHAIAKSVTAGSTTTTTYLHTDALGSPIAQSDAAKKVIGTSAHLPYGGLYSSTGTGNVAGLGYAGASADPTGLIYMHARYLDPQLHRFISLDPVEVDASAALNFNRLSYAENNPYAKYDPSGRESVSTMIRNGAEGCGPVTCAFWAAGTAVYQFSSLGFASWHDQWRDAYDNGQISGDEYARIGIAGGGALALTGVAIGGTLSEVGGALASEFADASAGNAVMLRHYTTSEFAGLIDASGTIRTGTNSGKIWLTTDRYASGADAQSALALPVTPDGYYEVPSYATDNLSDPATVEPAYNQPGGGTEMTTDQDIDVSDIPFIPFDGG
jgi:RHS repeat-associated protein